MLSIFHPGKRQIIENNDQIHFLARAIRLASGASLVEVSAFIKVDVAIAEMFWEAARLLFTPH